MESSVPRPPGQSFRGRLANHLRYPEFDRRAAAYAKLVTPATLENPEVVAEQVATAANSFGDAIAFAAQTNGMSADDVVKFFNARTSRIMAVPLPGPVSEAAYQHVVDALTAVTTTTHEFATRYIGVFGGANSGHRKFGPRELIGNFSQLLRVASHAKFAGLMPWTFAQYPELRASWVNALSRSLPPVLLMYVYAGRYKSTSVTLAAERLVLSPEGKLATKEALKALLKRVSRYQKVSL